MHVETMIIADRVNPRERFARDAPSLVCTFSLDLHSSQLPRLASGNRLHSTANPQAGCGNAGSSPQRRIQPRTGISHCHGAFYFCDMTSPVHRSLFLYVLLFRYAHGSTCEEEGEVSWTDTRILRGANKSAHGLEEHRTGVRITLMKAGNLGESNCVPNCLHLDPERSPCSLRLQQHSKCRVSAECIQVPAARASSL